MNTLSRALKLATAPSRHATPVLSTCIGKDWISLPFFFRRVAGSLHLASAPLFSSSETEVVYSNLHANPPQDIYEQSTFLVKLQLSHNPLNHPVAGNRILVYDFHRSLLVYVVEQTTDPEVFKALVDEMKSSRGGHGGWKMYRWARRTGPFELSVCLDNQPTHDISW